jgi:hypothetical protein
MTTIPSFVLAMQRQFVEGRSCDCIIRVSLCDDDENDDKDQNRSKKRRLTNANFATKHIDIPCHAVVLCSNSAYFRSALEGQYTEAQNKVVELTLVDQQAVNDLRLLLKLNYTGKYTKDEEVSLDRNTRMRLAFLGNALEFVDCVEQCLMSLGEGLNGRIALTVLNDIPEELKDHTIVKNVLKEKVIDILIRDLTALWAIGCMTYADKRLAKGITTTKIDHNTKAREDCLTKLLVGNEWSEFSMEISTADEDLFKSPRRHLGKVRGYSIWVNFYFTTNDTIGTNVMISTPTRPWTRDDDMAMVTDGRSDRCVFFLQIGAIRREKTLRFRKYHHETFVLKMDTKQTFAMSNKTNLILKLRTLNV